MRTTVEIRDDQRAKTLPREANGKEHRRYEAGDAPQTCRGRA